MEGDTGSAKLCFKLRQDVGILSWICHLAPLALQCTPHQCVANVRQTGPDLPACPSNIQLEAVPRLSMSQTFPPSLPHQQLPACTLTQLTNHNQLISHGRQGPRASLCAVCENARAGGAGVTNIGLFSISAVAISHNMARSHSPRFGNGEISTSDA
jgi:hypothetical protein